MVQLAPKRAEALNDEHYPAREQAEYRDGHIRKQRERTFAQHERSVFKTGTSPDAPAPPPVCQKPRSRLTHVSTSSAATLLSHEMISLSQSIPPLTRNGSIKPSAHSQGLEHGAEELEKLLLDLLALPSPVSRASQEGGRGHGSKDDKSNDSQCDHVPMPRLLTSLVKPSLAYTLQADIDGCISKRGERRSTWV